MENVQTVEAPALTSVQEKTTPDWMQQPSNAGQKSLSEEAPKLNPNKARLIFLDIDGVLISVKTALLADGWGRLYVDYSMYDGGWFNPDEHKILKEPYVKNLESIDKYAVGLLNKLCEVTNAHIVVSSTWRLGIDTYQLRNVLGAMGIDPYRVIGKTLSGGVNRGEEISNFLQGVGEKRSYKGPDFFVTNGRLIESLDKVELNVESYVIIDDVQAFSEDQQAHFVKTQETEGFTLDNCLAAGSILTGKDFGIPQLQQGEDCEG